MARILYAAPVVLLTTLFLGCTFNYPADTKSADSTAVAAPAGNRDKQPKNNAGGQKQAPAPDPDCDKKIVKTADLKLEVKSFDKFTKRLHEAVKQAGGYISQEDQVQSATEVSNKVTIKIPVLNFDDLLMQLPADSDRLIEKKISSQDVTMGSAAFSTINLHFYQLLVAPAPIEAPPSFFTRLRDSIGEGWGEFSDALLGVVRVWPLLIAFGLVVYGIRRYMNGVREKAAAARAPEEAAK